MGVSETIARIERECELRRLEHLEVCRRVDEKDAEIKRLIGELEKEWRAELAHYKFYMSNDTLAMADEDWPATLKKLRGENMGINQSTGVHTVHVLVTVERFKGGGAEEVLGVYDTYDLARDAQELLVEATTICTRQVNGLCRIHRIERALRELASNHPEEQAILKILSGGSS